MTLSEIEAQIAAANERIAADTATLDALNAERAAILANAQVTNESNENLRLNPGVGQAGGLPIIELEAGQLATVPVGNGEYQIIGTEGDEQPPVNFTLAHPGGVILTGRVWQSTVA